MHMRLLILAVLVLAVAVIALAVYTVCLMRRAKGPSQWLSRRDRRRLGRELVELSIRERQDALVKDFLTPAWKETHE